MKRTAPIWVLVGVVACAPDAFTEAQLLGGVTVDADVLNQGKRHYTRYCQPCHGESGDGRGPSSWGLWPSPRNFQKGVFKYAGVAERDLAPDAALARIIREGLNGTAMQPWDLPPTQLHATIQYIKTFSLAGAGYRDPDRQVADEVELVDPLAGKSEAAIERGKRLYHAEFQCSQCHPRYATEAELASWEIPGGRSEQPEKSVPKAAPAYGNVLLPPDFRVHPLRSIRTDARGRLRTDDLYRVIAYGLAGPMPGYLHLGEEEVWSVAHYLRHIAAPRP